LTFGSQALAPSGSRIEKPRSPAGRAIPARFQEHQRRIEAGRREYLLLKSQEGPEEAESGQVEVEMTAANTDLVRNYLSELAQHIVHVIAACNEEKHILEEDFDSGKNGIIIMESRLQTENIKISSEVHRVGSMMQFQQAMLEELRSGIHLLQEQDIKMVEEPTDLFSGIRAELEAQCKNYTDTGLQIFAQNISIQAVQK
jgi:hypothetical protein